MHAVLYMFDGGVGVILDEYISDFILGLLMSFWVSANLGPVSLFVCVCFLFDFFSYFPCDLILSNWMLVCIERERE